MSPALYENSITILFDSFSDHDRSNTTESNIFFCKLPFFCLILLLKFKIFSTFFLVYCFSNPFVNKAKVTKKNTFRTFLQSSSFCKHGKFCFLFQKSKVRTYFTIIDLIYQKFLFVQMQPLTYAKFIYRNILVTIKTHIVFRSK